MPTITQLQYIVSVDEERHFGKASKACHVSQPSLSLQIQKVEEELGVVIFDRSHKKVLTTPKGQLIVEQAKSILQEHKKLLDLSQMTSGHISGNFRFAVIPTLAPYLIPLFLGDFSKKNPLLKVFVEEQKTHEIIENLKNGHIDAGVVSTPLKEKNLIEKVLFYEPFFVYANKNHPFYQRKRIKEEDMTGEDLWLLEEGHCFKNQVVRYCSVPQKNNVLKNIHFEAGNFETLKNTIKSTKGYTLFPYLFVKALPPSERQIHVKPFYNPVPTRQISLVHSRNQWKKDIITSFLRSIEEKIPKEIKNQNLDLMEVLDIN